MFFFADPHFLKTILDSNTNGTFGFARHKNRPFPKPKEPLFCQSIKDNTILDKNKMLKKYVQYIAPFKSEISIFDTLNNLKAGATL